MGGFGTSSGKLRIAGACNGLLNTLGVLWSLATQLIEHFVGAAILPFEAVLHFGPQQHRIFGDIGHAETVLDCGAKLIGWATQVNPVRLI